jgi:glutamate/tyrosine decarboxylase-like PLP-dependent enzyme
VVGILGSTYNGEFEDIKGLNDMLGEAWCMPQQLPY